MGFSTGGVLCRRAARTEAKTASGFWGVVGTRKMVLEGGGGGGAGAGGTMCMKLVGGGGEGSARRES